MTAPRRINLALQGGGAHGAFTWGALERLLEEPEIEIAGISGTSAGALNGAAVKVGLAHGSREMALENLAWFWAQVGAIDAPELAPWLSAISPMAISAMIEASLPFAWADGLARVVSPYSSGPVYSNPLEPIVARFSYDDVCSDAGPDFHICATNVRTGKIRVFSGDDITPGALMASACLPTLFRAVEIRDPDTGRDEAYWDGGYTGNPALFPLYAGHLPDDVVVININPLHREELPTTAREIQNRINEISFNSSLLRELRAIEFVQRLLDADRIPQGAMKRVLIHMISDDKLMEQLSVATKLVPVPQVLHQLRVAGRAAAESFLDTHIDRIGVESSVDLRAMFN
ncbi:patatin-like phospholipase family protein [Rhodobacterales bacterium HKCCE3408]|nr:patatin-like phospholipase family protein [Rhodobacterales bacterium HKCCE3408]